MKIQIVKNKYINSALILMMFSAAIHMLILAIIAIRNMDLHILNYFYILSVDYFFPNFLHSFSGDIISIIFTGVIYLIILKKNRI
jgi:hypothetical protein